MVTRPTPGLRPYRLARDREQKAALAKLSPEQVQADTLAGEKIVAKLTRAPANDAPIGGLKVVSEWGPRRRRRPVGGGWGAVFAEDEAALLVAAARDAAELDALVQRRVVGTPLEHILGRAQFGGLRIAVDHRVFVPRRRTEFLARQAIELASLITDRGPIVLDLRCVSGAIAALVAAELAAAFAAGGLTPRTVGSDEFYATVVIGTAPA